MGRVRSTNPRFTSLTRDEQAEVKGRALTMLDAGRSYGEITNALGIPKSTLSYWSSQLGKRQRLRLGMTYVYFIQGVDGGPVKIGYATDPLERMRDFQVGSPVLLKLLLMVQGSYHDEARLHERFDSARLHGEWFTPTDELLQHIDFLAEWAAGRVEGRYLDDEVEAA